MKKDNESKLNVIIPQQYFDEILTEVGYPLIPISAVGEMINTKTNILGNGSNSKSEDELEKEITDNIKRLIIFPAMREYFKWFPIYNEQEYQVESTFNLDFPTPETFTVCEAHLNTAGFIARDSQNPFVNNSIYRSVTAYSSFGGGVYGTNNDYDFRVSRIYDRLERASVIDFNKAVRYDIDHGNRTLSGYTNVVGKLCVSWGEYSIDWNKIQFQRLPEVIKLAKSYLLRYIGTIRGSQVSNLPVSFNYQLYLDRADKLEKESLDVLKKLTKVVIHRQ